MSFEKPQEENERPFDALKLIPEGRHPRYKFALLQYKEEEVVLTQYEAEVYALLKSRNGGIVSKVDISNFLYGDREKDVALSNSLDVLIGKLKRKLTALTSGAYGVETVRGVGCRLVHN